MKPITFVELGTRPYGQILTLQHQLRTSLQAPENQDNPGYIFSVEHPATVTLGKRGKREDLRATQALQEHHVELFSIDRGGEATYHAPGQLILYPVLNLNLLGLGVVDVIHNLARCISECLHELHGIESWYDKDNPGVWLKHHGFTWKIASVGMRVSRGVTTHGVAVNLVNEMDGFLWIVPCGMPDSPLTSLAKILEVPKERQQDVFRAFHDLFVQKFCDWFEHPVSEGEIELPSREAWVVADDYGEVGE